MALGRRHLGIVTAALLLLLAPLLPAAAAGADDAELRGPFLVGSGRHGLVRTEVRPPHGHERVLTIRQGYVAHVSPAGRILVARYTDLSGERMRVVVAGDGRTHVLAGETSPCVSSLAISADGSLATYAVGLTDDSSCGSPTTVHLVAIDTGLVHDLPAPRHAGWFDTDPVFSPDGARVSLVGSDRGDDVVWVYDTATGERLRALRGYRPTDVPAADGVVVRRTGGTAHGARCRLFTVATDSSARPDCWDPALRLTRAEASGVTASPDGSTLAWVHRRHVVVAPVGDLRDRRDLGAARTGPGRPTASWISNRFVLTRSPEDDARAVRRVRDGRAVPGYIEPFYGWTR